MQQLYTLKIMDYTFKNNANEKFNFFLDEERNPCLNITVNSELLAAFIIEKEQLNFLIEHLTNIEKDAVG